MEGGVGKPRRRRDCRDVPSRRDPRKLAGAAVLSEGRRHGASRTNQIRAYFANALGRFTELRFELVSVTEAYLESFSRESSHQPSWRAAIEYRRHSNVDGANPAHVLELVQWEGALIKAARVFHF